MELLLKRDDLSETRTLGKLYVDGAYECETLEDKQRADDERKVFGQTAIPLGRYEVKITHSPRFGCDVPLLLNVPGYEGVRVHPGNTADDTEGCLLVGQSRGADRIDASRAAYNALFPKLKAALDRGEHIFITLEDA
jgi:hypothetical protein